MTPLFKKLNLGDHREILVLSPPESFERELEQLEGVTIRRKPTGTIAFAIAFVQTLAEVEACNRWLPKATGDAIVWMCYPKMTSKRYKCDFNRDTGWATLGAAGFEGVRMVAIDDDWSALRFRRVETIKNLTRSESMTLSEAGKARAKSAKKKG